MLDTRPTNPRVGATQPLSTPIYPGLRLRAAAVTPTSIATPAAEAPATPPAADAPTSHLEVSQAPPAAG